MLLVSVSVVLVICEDVIKLLINRIGNAIATTASRIKTSTNAIVRGHVAHPKHPVFVFSVTTSDSN